MSGSFARDFARLLKRQDFVRFHDFALRSLLSRRSDAVAKVPEWEDLRRRAKGIKATLRRDTGTLVARFIEQAESRGAKVRIAKTAEDANRIVHRLLEERGMKHVVKSKSMTTEECGLNPFLEARGVHVTDTDLGERIVQLFGEPPSHIVGPAIHRTRKEIGELFARHGLVAPGEEDPARLTEAARRSLREVFFEAECGITGANFLLADSGTVVVVENEGNSLLGTSLPGLHIVVAGIDKFIPSVRELDVFLMLLARSATGQRLTTYTTCYSGPQARSDRELEAGRELFIVLVDNGRSDLLGTPAEEALDCIRCGACLSACPVFRRVGGHAYDYVYPGPLGAVLGPGLGGRAKAGLPRASPLCGACSEICPVRIDLAAHIRDWRPELRRRGWAPSSLPPGLGFLMRHPRLFDRAMAGMRRLRLLSGPLLRLHPMVRSYAAGGQRRWPEVPGQSFRQWWRARTPVGGTDRGLPRAEASRPVKPRVSGGGIELEALFREALLEAGGEPILPKELPAGAVATERVAGMLGLERAPVSKEDLNGVP
ncbi:MAG: lactate utilization protein B, partial [Planctomycetota bacterium]